MTTHGSLIIGWRLHGRHVIIIGGNQVAANRLDFALYAKPAKITLITPRKTLSSERLLAHIENRVINYIDREFQESDLDSQVDLILSATDNPPLSQKIALAARERHIPINVAEIPQLCDFLFMPTYKDQYLQVAISTNSSSPDANTDFPLVARKLRQHILESLPKQQDISTALNNLALLKETLGNSDVAALSKITDTLPWEQLARLSEHDIQQLVAKHSTMNGKVDIDDEIEASSTSSSDEKKSEDTFVEENGSSPILIRSKLVDRVSLENTGGIQLVDGKTAITYVAYALSKTSFVYPTTRSEYVGEIAQRLSAENFRNAFGKMVQVIPMETRSGAATAIIGAAINDGSLGQISAFATSQAIVKMIPIFYAISSQHIPLVVHVAAQGNDHEMNNYINYHDSLEARNTGFSIFNSYSVQEAHDIALIAHLSSVIAKTPSLHLFDGVRTAHELSNVSLLSYSDIAKIFSELTAETPTIKTSSSNHIATVIETVANKIGKITGRQYKLFEYFGAHDAESLLVVLGTEAVNVKETVTRLGNYGGKVGAIIVRVYRPWSEKHFLAAVPKTVKRMAILEQVSDSAWQNSSLFSDIAASFQSELWKDVSPILVDLKYPITQQFNTRIVKLVLHQLAAGKTIDFNDDLLSAIDIPAVSHKLKQCVFWDSESAGTFQSTKHVAHILSRDPELNISSLATYDVYNNGGVVTTYLQFGTDRIAGVYDGEAGADYIAIHDLSLTTKYDILTAAKENSVVLLNTSATVDELETKLPSDFRFEAAKRNIHLYTVDANKIVKEAGLSSDAINVVLQTAFLKLYKNTNLDAVLQNGIIDLYEGKNTENGLSSILTSIIEATENALTRIELPPTWLPLGKSNNVLPSAILSNSFGPNLDLPSSQTSKVGNWHTAAFNLLFKEAYQTAQQARPDLAEKTFVVHVSENRRLTPSTYDRNLFHIEFDTTGTDLKYEIGEALGVYGHNDQNEVNQFLEYYELNPNDVVSIPGKDGTLYETRTVLQLFSQVLDVFGRPSKRFYEALASYATNQAEKNKLLWIAGSEGSQEFKRRVDDTTTYAELLYEFPSARPTAQELAELIAPIKPRHYSIASAQSVHPNSVHLLVVTVDWMNSKGKRRFGQCTRYLADLKIGEKVTVSIKPSVMKLPPLDTQPVIMAGLGTGMAPFRAFIEERAYRKSQGIEVGPMVLYFGSRNRAMEYLYGEELEAYHTEGVLSYLRLAFSRDQAHKVYIQHKMQEDAEILHQMLLKEDGWFYLCGPTWPVPDVRDAIVNSFVKAGGLSPSEAGDWVNKLKDLERYILEVY